MNADNFDILIQKIDEHIKKINEQTNRIKVIDAKIKWHKAQLAGVAQYYDSKQSGDYTGD